MTILTDTDISEKLSCDYDWDDKSTLNIYPYSEESLTPVGYDLRAGGHYATSDEGLLIDLKEGMNITIFPKQTALITTRERISMPQNRSLSALIVSKVSKVSKGLSHVATTIDADWSGNLLIALTNHSYRKIVIGFEEAFCTVIFFANHKHSTKLCGKQDGRPDILLDDWAEISKQAIEAEKKNRRAKKRGLFISPLIILLGAALGYTLFGPRQPAIIAMVGVSVGISQVYNSYLTLKD
jgi:deoxycytidine triphosphate deaminase